MRPALLLCALVGLIGVADRPTILRDYTTDLKQQLDGVNKVFAMPDSGATLLDAIVETSKGLQRREDDRAAIVILTTENVEVSTLHYKDVIAQRYAELVYYGQWYTPLETLA